MKTQSIDRLKVGTERLKIIHDEVLAFFKDFDTEKEFDDLGATAYSVEGDELHQFVDCVMSGPYASAEIPKGVDSYASSVRESVSENADTYHGSMLYYRKSRQSCEF
jgi:hypothetical protein